MPKARLGICPRIWDVTRRPRGRIVLPMLELGMTSDHVNTISFSQVGFLLGYDIMYSARQLEAREFGTVIGFLLGDNIP